VISLVGKWGLWSASAGQNEPEQGLGCQPARLDNLAFSW
jgi:hypothetical protein